MLNNGGKSPLNPSLSFLAHGQKGGGQMGFVMNYLLFYVKILNKRGGE